MIIDDNKFKKVLKQKGINRSSLCQSIGISSRTLAKISKGEDIADNVAMRIIQYLGVGFDILYENRIANVLRKEKTFLMSERLLEKTQTLFAYTSNKIAGSQITLEQTKYIYKTRKFPQGQNEIAIDDITTIANHFNCICYILDFGLTNIFLFEHIATLYFWMTQGTSLFNPDVYRSNSCAIELGKLVEWFNKIKKIKLETILEFHYKFEKIHPFVDGNGRVGRLIMLLQCLRYNIVPIPIDEKVKDEYIEGLKNWHKDRSTLLKVCKKCQKQYIELMDELGIKY